MPSERGVLDQVVEDMFHELSLMVHRMNLECGKTLEDITDIYRRTREQHPNIDQSQLNHIYERVTGLIARAVLKTSQLSTEVEYRVN